MVHVVVHVYATPTQAEALTRRLSRLVALDAADATVQRVPAPATVTAELVRQWSLTHPDDDPPGRAGHAIVVQVGPGDDARRDAAIDRICTALLPDRTGNTTAPVCDELAWLIRIER